MSSSDLDFLDRNTNSSSLGLAGLSSLSNLNTLKNLSTLSNINSISSLNNISRNSPANPSSTVGPNSTSNASATHANTLNVSTAPSTDASPTRKPYKKESYEHIKTHFPAARIKKLMQSDDDIGKVAQATPVVVGKALEIFLCKLVEKSCDEARLAGAKKINALHVKSAVDRNEKFDFLVDLVAKYGNTHHSNSNSTSNSNSNSNTNPINTPTTATYSNTVNKSNNSNNSFSNNYH
ncbi:negative cofactor 2 transcription regulator complex subunit BUR6 [Ascoidea rubescens DSM 1968]|uniref:Histone-fold-containing protein n=1 Tax=Ascoidea rubescens DSM 1968 TaxID=1344418 RepID=A0A1D2VEB4_9ASCO|nr:histone-fold-containing protein [Ascoidea rubescens DSM 1968]ODV59976.1 histone-fold-containing protein [Ascoidea rubescens DSM 1968]